MSGKNIKVIAFELIINNNILFKVSLQLIVKVIQLFNLDGLTFWED